MRTFFKKIEDHVRDHAQENDGVVTYDKKLKYSVAGFILPFKVCLRCCYLT